MQTTTISIADVQQKVAAAAFGRPLVTNVLRGQVVEAIIACTLEPEWTWCAEDYSSWDFERADGLRLEVKQSAARQTWTVDDKPSAASFDIKQRQFRWEGQERVDEPGRAAHLYIFAHHPVIDASADHRDPTQWVFYVVATSRLPDTQRISLAGVRQLTGSCSYVELAQKVAEVAANALPSPIGA